MALTQSFCLVGKPDIEEIRCSQVDGNSIIFWEDIEQVFPGVQYVKNGNVTVSLMRDSSGNRMIPHRIEHFPGEVLNVILPTFSGNGPNTFSTQSSRRTDGRVIGALSGATILSQSARSHNSNDNLGESNTMLAKRAKNKVIESKFEEQLFNSLPSDVQARVRASTNAHDALVQVIKDGLVSRPNDQLVACLQELKDTVDERNEMALWNMDLVSENKELATLVVNLQETLKSKQDEMKQLPMEALGELALLQNSVKTLLAWTYELHEDPIPRLFIVLPADEPSWNPFDVFSNKFRLYFLCECGEHTKTINAKILHHIHLAKHEGYDIPNPKEFFRLYGSYVLTILRMLKFGISMEGIVVPAVSNLIRDDALCEVTSNLKMSIGNISSGMDKVMSCIEHISANEGVVDGCLQQAENNSALEGVDLRQLETLLKNKNSYHRVLGGLYRIVSSKGHVKYACDDHFRDNNQERVMRSFRDTVAVLGGSFDESIGRVEVRILSRFQAEQFYIALEKAKSIYELKVCLNWETTQKDFKKLRDTLANTNVGILSLYLYNGDGPTNDILNRGQRYDPIFDIMLHTSIKSVTIRGIPLNFTKRSSLQSRKDDFLNLRHLNLDVKYLKHDLSGLRTLIVKAPNLSSLTFSCDRDDLPQVYNAITGHHICPVTFQDLSLHISPPRYMYNPRYSTMDLKNMSDLLQVHGGRIETVELSEYLLDDSTIAEFAKAIENGSRLKELTLRWDDRIPSGECIKSLATIIARSELRKLDINVNKEEELAHILGSIQWKHLRVLEIRASQHGMVTRVMEALMDGVKKVSGKVPLREFRLITDPLDPQPMTQGELLTSFMASTLLRVLQLDVVVTFRQMLSLFKSMDLSQLQKLSLQTKDVHSIQIETLLDSLQDDTALQYLTLRGADITEEQKARMNARGTHLLNW